MGGGKWGGIKKEREGKINSTKGVLKGYKETYFICLFKYLQYLCISIYVYIYIYICTSKYIVSGVKPHGGDNVPSPKPQTV